MFYLMIRMNNFQKMFLVKISQMALVAMYLVHETVNVPLDKDCCHYDDTIPTLVQALVESTKHNKHRLRLGQDLRHRRVRHLKYTSVHHHGRGAGLRKESR